MHVCDKHGTWLLSCHLRSCPKPLKFRFKMFNFCVERLSPRCGLFAIARLSKDTYECKLCKDWCDIVGFLGTDFRLPQFHKLEFELPRMRQECLRFASRALGALCSLLMCIRFREREREIDFYIYIYTYVYACMHVIIYARTYVCIYARIVYCWTSRGTRAS